MSLAGELLALAAEAKQATLLVRGITDQATLTGHVAGYVTVPTTTRDIHLPKERP